MKQEQKIIHSNFFPKFYAVSYKTDIYIYIYIYIYMCVCVCMCVYVYIYIYIYCHPQTDCVARHVGHSKPGLKPIQLYVWLSLRPLGQQAYHVG